MGNFDRVNATEPHLDRAQKRIQDGIGRGNPPMNEGAEVSVTISGDGEVKTVAHKLDRKARGFQIISEEGNGTGSLQAVELGTKSIRLALRVPTGASPTTIKYKLWVY